MLQQVKLLSFLKKSHVASPWSAISVLSESPTALSHSFPPRQLQPRAPQQHIIISMMTILSSSLPPRASSHTNILVTTILEINAKEDIYFKETLVPPV